MIVISEKSLIDDTFILKDFMIITDYHNLINQIIDVINNYDEYYNKLFNNFNIDEINKHYISLINVPF